MRFGSLFSGVGGIDLGLERAGMIPAFQVENNSYATKVLAKHWPHVRRHSDVRTFPPEPASDWSCDLIAGGFPCQPVSVAGRRQGDKDDRWLWPEFARIIRVLRPRYVLLENTPGLLFVDGGRLFGIVLSDLDASGYDATWDCLPAAAFGTPHLRDRLFVIAYPHGERCEELHAPSLAAREGFLGRPYHEDRTDANRFRQTMRGERQAVPSASSCRIDDGGRSVSDSRKERVREAGEDQAIPSDAESGRQGQLRGIECEACREEEWFAKWQ